MDEEFDSHNHSKDGIDNQEHILDMQKQLSMLIENIKDNTDTAFSILKMHENDNDQDTVDVYRINCSNILDCEKLASKKYEIFGEIVNNFKDTKDILLHLQEMEDIFDEIDKYEKSSSHYLQSLLNLLRQ